MKNESLIAIVKVALNCPANCPACSSRKGTFAKMRPRVMDLDYFGNCLRQLTEIGVQRISLSGGEPTLLANLGDYVAVCHKYGISSQLNTNGWNVTDQALSQWLDNGLQTVILSCYSLNPDVFVRLRGNSALLGKTRQAIQAIAEQRQKREFTAILQTIITSINMMEMPDLLRAAIEAGFDLFWPSYLEDAGSLPDLRMSRHDIEQFKQHCIPEMKRVASSVADIRAVRPMHDQLGRLFNHPDTIPAYWAMGDYGHIPRICPLVENFALFYPDHTIAPCAGHEYYWSSFVERNEGQHLRDILQGERFEQFRRERMPYCRYCPHGLHVGLALRYGAHE